MANNKALPGQGNTQWGATLNNYIRSLQEEITSVQNQMNNFTIAASYDGSGFYVNKNKYSLTLDSSSGTMSGKSGTNINGFPYNEDQYIDLLLTGDVYFQSSVTYNSSSTLAIESKKIRIGAGSNSDSYTPDLVAKVLKRRENVSDGASGTSTVTYLVTELGGTEYSSLVEYAEDTKRIYMPLYIHRTKESDGFSWEVVISGYGYVYDSDFVLFGVLELLRTGDSSYETTIILRHDSASKSTYESRRENREAYASIVSVQKTDTDSSGLNYDKQLWTLGAEGTYYLNLLDSRYILCTNGINASSETSSYVSSTSDDNNSSVVNVAELDSKEFVQNANNKVIIVSKQTESENENYILHSCQRLTLQTITDTDGNIIISASPNLFIDSSDTVARHCLYGVYVTASGRFIIEKSPKGVSHENYQWSLPYDSDFECGSLVLLGCFHISRLNGNVIEWEWNENTYGGVKSSLLTNQAVETTPFVCWDAVTYEYGGDAYAKFAIDKNSSSAATPFNFIFKPWGSGLDFEIPLFEKGTITASSNSITLKKLIITENGIKVDGNVAATGDVTGSSIKGSHFDLSADWNDTDRTGTVVLKHSGDTSYTNNIQLKLCNNKDNQTFSFGTTEDANDWVSFSKSTGKVTMSVPGSTLYITTGGEDIELANNINFTSDRRCKENISPIDNDICYQAIKNIDVNTYNYIGNVKQTLGIIAQDIEKYLPQYKDLLVSITDDGNLHDKRTVSEIKLLFIIWGALKRLIEKIEGDDK